MGFYWSGEHFYLKGLVKSKIKCRAIALFFSSILHIRANTRMIWIFTLIATSLDSTPDNIATPSSVNAYGGVRLPPQLEIPIWNIKLSKHLFKSLNY